MRTVQNPPVAQGSTRTVRPGLMERADLAGYRAILRAPTRTTYHGLDVYSMAPSSSGGTTVGEALNILENFHLSPSDTAQALHDYLEASRIAFADRNRWVGDPAFSDVPTRELLAKEFAKDRACLISPTTSLTSPVAPGDPLAPAGCTAPGTGSQEPYEGPSTTHLVACDRWGNVVSYTLTIEQTGGSAITVPGRGFLLNNELTDFDFTPLQAGVPDPNLPGPGKRPRSSMSPTIVLRDGRPLIAVGSPGGATIITTVLQTLVNMCQDCLIPREAVAHDCGAHVPDDHTNTLATQSRDLHPAILDQTSASEHGEPAQSTCALGAGAGTGLPTSASWRCTSWPSWSSWPARTRRARSSWRWTTWPPTMPR